MKIILQNRLQVFSLVVLALVFAPINASHAHDGQQSIRAGTVTRALLEQPTALTSTPDRLRQKITTDSAKAQAYYDQGFSYLSSYVWIEAARSFHEALRLDPELAMAYLGLAKTYAGIDAPGDAKAYVNKASELAGKGKVTAKEVKWIALGVQQRAAISAPAEQRAQKHQAYKLAIDELIMLDPYDPHAWVLRGNAEEPGAWGRGQMGGVGSIAYYQTALSLDPKHLGAHHYLVHSYEWIGRHATAAEHGAQYVEAASEVPHAHHMYGHVLPRLGKWKEAQTQLVEADRLEREYSTSLEMASEEDWHHGHNLHLLGIVQMRLGNYEKTEELFQEAFHLEAREPLIDMWLGRIAWPEYLLLRGRLEEALAAAQDIEGRSFAAAQTVGAALVGDVLVALGRIDEAKEAEIRAKKAYKELLVKAQNTVWEALIPAFSQPLFDNLEIELALRGPNRSAAEQQLLKMADALVANPFFDTWGHGIYRLERFAADARRDGHTALAGELVKRIRQIDSGFVAGAALDPVASTTTLEDH